MAMASQVPPKWCFGRDLSEMSWSPAKTVGTILNCALLNFLSQEKGKWFKKAFDGNNIRFGAFLKSFVKSSIIARISITDFSKPRFNFSSHWKKFIFKPLNFAGDTILIVEKKIQGDFETGSRKVTKLANISLRRQERPQSVSILIAYWGGVAQNQWTDTSILIFHQCKPTKHETDELNMKLNQFHKSAFGQSFPLFNASEYELRLTTH